MKGDKKTKTRIHVQLLKISAPVCRFQFNPTNDQFVLIPNIIIMNIMSFKLKKKKAAADSNVLLLWLLNTDFNEYIY